MGAPVTKRLERAEAVAPMHDLVENEDDTRPGLSPPDLVAADPVDRRTEPRGCDHSMIRTLRERWYLGPALTRRDATAPDIPPVLTRSTPRPQEDWPDLTPQPVPQLTDALVAVDRPLSPLGKYLLGVAIALDEHYTGPRPRPRHRHRPTGRQLHERPHGATPGRSRQKEHPLIGHEQTPAPNVRSPRVVRGHALVR
jgi:hypothetical protein